MVSKKKASKTSPKNDDPTEGKTVSLSEGAKVFHSFSLGRDIGVVSVSAYEGKVALDIRRFYLSDDEEWKPTAKGIRIPAQSVREVLTALANNGDAIVRALGA